MVGVPAATWLGQNLGWRSAFWTVGLLGLLTLALVRLFVPAYPGDPDATGRRELSAFTSSQVWLTLLAGAIGFGGMFAVYTYIAPTLTEVGGLSEGAVPVFLLAFGLGMVFGTWLAGEMADWSVVRLAVHRCARDGRGARRSSPSWRRTAGGRCPLVFAITVAGSVLVVNLQLRLMVVAGDAQTLGAALNHASLNVANALGAWLGGVVIAAGWGYRSPALVGVALSLARPARAGAVVPRASSPAHRLTPACYSGAIPSARCRRTPPGARR